MKLKTCIPETSLYAKGWGIIFQVVLIFFFLTIFFFLYVSQVEKIEFKKQMDIIVDDLAPEVKIDLPQESRGEAYLIVNGVLAYENEKVKISSKSVIEKINERNRKVVTKAVNGLVIVGFVVVVGLLSLFLLGYCFPIKNNLTNAAIAVVVVGAVELFFLLVIAKHYISANPQQFRESLGAATVSYVNNRK